jgi:hypothetical protein
MQKYGAMRIAQVMLSENWYRENMPKYKAAFEDRSILLPKDADIIEDHRAFRVIKYEMAGYADIPHILTAGIRHMTSELDGYHGSVRYGAY